MPTNDRFIPNDSNGMEAAKAATLSKLGLRRVPDVLVLFAAGFGTTTDIYFSNARHEAPKYGEEYSEYSSRIMDDIMAGEWRGSAYQLMREARYRSAPEMADHLNSAAGLLEWGMIVKQASKDLGALQLTLRKT